MTSLKAILLPAGIGVFIVVLGAIAAIWDEGLRATRAGPVSLSGFLAELTTFVVLVCVILGLVAMIRNAA